MWYMHDGAPSYFSRAVRDVLNNIYHGRWIGWGGPTAWPPRYPDLNPLDFYLWGHPKTLVYAAPVDKKEAPHQCIIRRCLSDYPQLLRHFCTDVAVHEICRGTNSVSWKTFWALIMNIIFTYNSQNKYLRTNVHNGIFFCYGTWNS
jgi:hypothetical protein